MTVFTLQIVIFKVVYYQVGAIAELLVGGFWTLVLVILLIIKKRLKIANS